jgi:hypothetical protein
MVRSEQAMTVMQSYSLSLTYSSLRIDLPHRPPATVPASSETTPAAPAGDTVTLSPEATAQAETPEAPVPSPEAPSAPPSRAERRSEALLTALDADQDGAVTKQEFLDGAMALLRRAGARHRQHDHDRVRGEGHRRHGHEGHGMHRLERKLDRLFERVDASGDGSVDQAELTDALRKVTRERRPHATETPAPSAQQPPAPASSPAVPSTSPSPETPPPATVSTPQPPAAAMSYTSVTVVIAVKQYTSVAAMKA